MGRLKLPIIFFILVVLISSCSFESLQNEPEYNPVTLKELHDGFFNEELTPEINNHNKDSIVIVATGHLYPMLNYPLAYKAMIDSIIKQKPDYLFLLGDLVKNNTTSEWDTVLTRFARSGTQIYYSPGNHDLNYHYERWHGSRENQFEAEMLYIDKIGYRYKLLKDKFANYVFMNPNDSLDRFLEYLNKIRPKFDTTKMNIFLSSQCMWHKKSQIPGDNHTWMNKAFTRDEILPEIEDFDYLVHGDWGGKIHTGFWPKSNGRFNVIAVGNRIPGDSLFIARLIVTDNNIDATSIRINPPEESSWYDKDKKW